MLHTHIHTLDICASRVTGHMNSTELKACGGEKRNRNWQQSSPSCSKAVGCRLPSFSNSLGKHDDNWKTKRGGWEGKILRTVVNLASLLRILPCTSSRIAILILVALGRIAFSSQPASLHHLVSASLGIHGARRRGRGTGSLALTHCCCARSRCCPLSYMPFLFFCFTIVLCLCPSESLSLISRLLGLPLDLSASEGLRKHDKTADHRVGGRENKTPQLSIRAVPMAQPALPEAVRPALFPQEGDAGSPPSTHEGKRNRRKNTDEEKKRSCEVRPPADPYGRSSGGADKRRLVRPVFRDESGIAALLPGRNGMQTQSLASKPRFKSSTRAGSASAGSAKAQLR